MERVSTIDATLPIAMPEHREHHALTQYATHDVTRLGAKRHPDADLLRALADRVRHHAVDADHCQQHGDAREDAEHGGGDALRGEPR